MTETVKKILQKNQLVIWYGATASMSALLLIFVMVPQVTSYISGMREAGNIKQKSDILSSKIAGLNGIDRDEYQGNLRLALQALPEEEDVLQGVDYLQRLVEDSGLQVMNVAYSGVSEINVLTKAQSDLNNYRLSLEVQGSTKSLEDFLENVKSSSRTMQTTGIEIASEKKTGTNNISLSMELYFKLLPKDIGAADEPLPVFTEEERSLLAKFNLDFGRIAAPTQVAPSVSKGRSDPFE